MKTLLSLLLLSLVMLGDEVKIASYNVENLFDMHYSGSEYAEYIPNTSWQWNQKNYRIKLKNIAKVIADIKPDIIALQEIESKKALRDLQAEIQRAGHYLPYLAITHKKTNIKVALLSKMPLHAKDLFVSHAPRERNILEAKVQLGNESLYLFVNHWKAKSGPESRRMLSAKALKKRLNTLGNVNYVVLGDLNSDYREYETFVKKRKLNDTQGRTGINHILQTIDGGQPITLTSLKENKSYSYNLWYELPKKERYSHIYRGIGEGLDHIIISPALANNRGVEYQKQSFHTFKAPYLFHKNKIYRWQRSRTHPKHHIGKGYSDHLPIYATFSYTNRFN